MYLEIQLVHLFWRVLCWSQHRLDNELSALDRRVSRLVLPPADQEEEETEAGTDRVTADMEPGPQEARELSTHRFRSLPGQATLEWVLVGGVMVVIVVGLLVTIFQPQLEAIVTNILKLVQQNTGGPTPTGVY